MRLVHAIMLVSLHSLKEDKMKSWVEHYGVPLTAPGLHEREREPVFDIAWWCQPQIIALASSPQINHWWLIGNWSLRNRFEGNMNNDIMLSLMLINLKISAKFSFFFIPRHLKLFWNSRKRMILKSKHYCILSIIGINTHGMQFCSYQLVDLFIWLKSPNKMVALPMKDNNIYNPAIFSLDEKNVNYITK